MNVTHNIAEMYVDIREDSKESECAIEKLRAEMTKEQRKLLLVIIDEYFDKTESMAYKNFERGFHLGIRLGREVFSRRSKDYL